MNETSEKQFYFLNEQLKKLNNYVPQKGKDVNAYVRNALFSTILSLTKNIVHALQKNHIYVACSLACLVVEAEIQLLWINIDPDKRSKAFYDFGFIEQLNSISIHPEWEADILTRIEENNCSRFLDPKKKQPSIKERSSYFKDWYNLFNKKNLRVLSEENFQEGKKIATQSGKKISDIDIDYKNYKVLCKFKHFSPFCILPCFGNLYSFNEKERENFRELAIKATLQEFYISLLVLIEHGEPIELVNGIENILKNN